MHTHLIAVTGLKSLLDQYILSYIVHVQVGHVRCGLKTAQGAFVACFFLYGDMTGN